MPLALPAILAVHAPTAAQIARQLAAESHRCSGKLTLTGDGVGAVRVGATVAAVRKACHVGRVKKQRDDEAQLERVLEFKIGKTPITAELDHGRVWRVVVDGEDLKTLDKLGVGSPLSSLLAYGDVTAAEGEGWLYATIPGRCGVSFRLSYEPKTGEDRDNWTTALLSRLPADTQVTQVLLFGCKPSR